MTDQTTKLDTYVRDARPRFEGMLAELVQLPSISMDPAHAVDVRRTADLAIELLRELGADAQIVETGGHPLVSGGWMAGRHHPTLTIYNHLDVQPAQEPGWRELPFVFRKEDGVYHGRGTTDDKGPALTALLAAKYAIDEGVPLNIRVCWELEEEIGSPNFAAALANRLAIPRPDSVVISDTVWVARDRPAASTGLRGLLGVRLLLQTGDKDAHSGLTGGAARNPLAELCAIASACVDARSGRVTIPGFYDDVVTPTKKELAEFRSAGFQVARFKRAYGFRSLRSTSAADIVQRVWARPTFEVHGVVGGYTGPGVKTVVPGHGELKVTMRLVPDQTPAKAFRLLKRYVTRLNPDITVVREGMLEPFRGVVSGPYAEAVRRAFRAGFGKEPAFVREGGSIGAVQSMARAWRVPILFLGLSLPEHGYHAPNEHYDWGQAEGGMKMFAAYFQEVARLSPRG